MLDIEEESFFGKRPTAEACWRSIVLFGRNVASYKFALARTLLDFASKGTCFVPLEELALPYARYLVEHVRSGARQGTFQSSKFVETCRKYAEGEVDESKLLGITVRLGFTNVIDAFHVVNQQEVPVRFYEDHRTAARRGLVLTDELLRLPERTQFQSLPREIEARWRLVETAWTLRMPQRPLLVTYDVDDTLLHALHERRPPITGCREALNGYQKGKCFYCQSNIGLAPGGAELAEIDHFFPRVLLRVPKAPDLDGVWNLVLACQRCNRGEGGKFSRVPNTKYLERLFRRNEYLISSHHPLRETLIYQTGQNTGARADFLRQVDAWAVSILIHRWTAPEEMPDAPS